MADIAYDPIKREAYTLIDGQWQPTQVAKGQDGSLYALSDGQWESFDAPGIDAKSAISSAMKNAIPSAVKFGKGIIEPLMSPMQTLDNLGRLANGAVQKTGILSPDMPDNTPYADAVGAEMKDRYGGWENIKRTFATDPVGLAGDAATLLAGGGAALRGASLGGKVPALSRAGEVMGQAATWADPIGLLGKPMSLIPLPEKFYGAALKPSTTLTPTERRGVIATGLEEKIPVSKGGSDKLDALSASQAKVLDATLMSNNIPGISPDDAVNRVRNDTTMAALATGNPSTNLRRVNNVYDEHLTDPMIPDAMTPKQANMIKQDLQREVEGLYGALRPPMEGRAKKDLARGYRQEIEAAVPEAADINAQIAKLIKLREQLQSAVGRVENRNPLSLPAMAAGAAGAPSGNAANAAGLATMLGLPWMGSEIAFGLDNLRRGEIGLPKASLLGRPLRLGVNDRAFLNAFPAPEEQY